jgi:hypothetical protein
MKSNMKNELSDLYCEVFGFGKPKDDKIVLTGAPQQVQATTAPEGEAPFNANATIDDITAKYKGGARWLVIVPKGDKQDYYMVNNPKSPEFQSKIGSRPHISLYVTNLIGNTTPNKA